MISYRLLSCKRGGRKLAVLTRTFPVSPPAGEVLKACRLVRCGFVPIKDGVCKYFETASSSYHSEQDNDHRG